MLIRHVFFYLYYLWMLYKYYIRLLHMNPMMNERSHTSCVRDFVNCHVTRFFHLYVISYGSYSLTIPTLMTLIILKCRSNNLHNTYVHFFSYHVYDMLMMCFILYVSDVPLTACMECILCTIMQFYYKIQSNVYINTNIRYHHSFHIPIFYWISRYFDIYLFLAK